jgi:drug/metabolite transporter (DMT)-like permease
MDNGDIDPDARPQGHWHAYAVLHIIFIVYSLAAVLSKVAAGMGFPSVDFVICYGGVLALLATYAVGWQWVLRSLPLSKAYVNKGVTVVWGIIWGVTIFDERVTRMMMIGAALVIMGIILVVTDEG